MEVVFSQLADLPAPARAERLVALASSAPALARELGALFHADGAAGDFLGVLSELPRTTVPPSIEPGNLRVGPYRIVSLLGHGGMSTVWLAHDDRLDRPVALKLLAGAWTAAATGSLEARGRLLAEARAAARLDHPHVAAIYDVGAAASGEPYIAMAYCNGGSRADRLAFGPLPLAEALRIGRQLAAARRGEHARAIALYEEVRVLAEPLEDRIMGRTFRARLAMARYELGMPAAEAAEPLAESLARMREVGHAWSISFRLASLGRIHRDAGDLERARTELGESLAVRRGVGDRTGVAESEALLADLERRSGERAAARARLGSPLSPRDRIYIESRREDAERMLGPALFEETCARGAAATEGVLVALAYDVVEDR